jgi:hypothetical protein
VYIVLLVVSIAILMIYMSQVKVPMTINVKNPTYNQYLDLYKIHQKTLSCPCRNMSIVYDQFIKINVSLHQVCHSVYVTLAWRNYIDSSTNISQALTSFSYIGAPLFQVLSSFCNLTSTIITDGLIDFYATQFISEMVMPHDIFEQESNELIRLFISSTTRIFAPSLDVIRDMTHSNGLASGLMTNIVFVARPVMMSGNITNYGVYMKWLTFSDASSNCSCADTPLCTMPVHVGNDGLFHLPGIRIGCYIVEALLQSNLICFYNQSCIDDLRHALNSTMSLNTTALDPTMPSRYKPNTTIDDIIAQLMVEQWKHKTSHKDYYAQCHPETCTYTHSVRNSLLLVITTIIGIIEGLSIILKIVVYRIVKALRSPWRSSTGEQHDYMSNESFFMYELSQHYAGVIYLSRAHLADSFHHVFFSV